MNELYNNEIEETPEVQKAIELPESEKRGFEAVDEDYDSQWENPSYEDIVNTPDVEEEAYRAEDEDFVKAWNTGASAGLDATVDGLDTSGFADYVNGNDALVEKEIDFGSGAAESMREMNGNEITQTDLFMAKSDAIANGYEEMPEETPIEEIKSEEDDDFKVEQNNSETNIETDTETIEEMKNQGYEVDMEVTEPDVKSEKDDLPKTENIESEEEDPEIDEERLEGIGVDDDLEEEEIEDDEPEIDGDDPTEEQEELEEEPEQAEEEKDDEKKRNNIFNNFGR